MPGNLSLVDRQKFSNIDVEQIHLTRQQMSPHPIHTLDRDVYRSDAPCKRTTSDQDVVRES